MIDASSCVREAALTCRSVSSPRSHGSADGLLTGNGPSAGATRCVAAVGDGPCRLPRFVRGCVLPSTQRGARVMRSAPGVTWQRQRQEGEASLRATAAWEAFCPFPYMTGACGSIRRRGTAWDWGSGLERRTRREGDDVGVTHGSSTRSSSESTSDDRGGSHGEKSARANDLEGEEKVKGNPDRVAAAVDWDRGVDEEKKEEQQQQHHHHHQQQQQQQEKVKEEEGRTAGKWKVAMLAAATILFGVVNRVSFKLALVPLREYPFFMAQMLTLTYVCVYFSVLYIRKKTGAVTDEMLSLPKTPFMFMGFLEAMGLALSMASGVALPGAVIPILNQSFLVWQLAWSRIFLKKRYSIGQLLGCALVIFGVVRVASSGSGGGAGQPSWQGAGLIWPLLSIASTAFPAGATILKEKVFREAPSKLEGRRPLDLFVVNSFGSAFQALFLLLLMPLLASFKGIAYWELPTYLQNGAACFLNLDASAASACDGAPWLPLLYMTSNLSFNILALQLLKVSSAIVASLAIAVSVPLSAAVFTLPLPFLGEPQPLSSAFFMGAAVLVLGVLLYNLSAAAGQKQSKSD